MKEITLLGASLVGICCLIGCGSGGGGDDSATPQPATVLVKIYYDAPTNTMLQEEGLVLVGSDGKPTATKHGLWKTYFPPADSNGIETEKIYVNGSWDDKKEWAEYNADSSIRDTMADGSN